MGSSEISTTKEEKAGQSLSSGEVLGHLTQTASGEHNVLVYPDLECFRKVYPKYCKKLLENNDIVIFLPYYEEIDRIKSHLVNEEIDLRHEQSKGNLIIVDAVREFFGAHKDILSFFVNLERQIKALGKNNLSVIACMGAFHHYENKIDEMIEYESHLDLSSVRNWKILCCYDERDFARFTDEQKYEVIGRHCRKIFCVNDSEAQNT